mgnify:CR=1 FL=1
MPSLLGANGESLRVGSRRRQSTIALGARVSLPGGPGSQEGLGESFQPNMATGTASHSISLAAPVGVEFVQHQEAQSGAVSNHPSIQVILTGHQEFEHHEVGQQNVGRTVGNRLALLGGFLSGFEVHLLAIAGQVIQQVDLSANLNAGDVYIGSGAYAASSIDQRHVPFSNFSVYQLPA